MTPDPAPKKDFFISYNQADKAWAEWIAWQLTKAGYTIIIQAWDFRPGANFFLEMQQATTGSERTIAVLSDHYLNASYTQPEWTAAFVQDPTSSLGKLLPVRVQECHLDGMWKPLVYIDLVGLNADQTKACLLAGISRESVRPQTEPLFPGQQPLPGPQPRFPGHVPAIWNIPHPRNPNFTGREDLLTALHKALHQEGASILTQTLHGLGGVGKTQTAMEYAYRWAFEYDLVWWLGSEASTRLACKFAALAVELNLPEKDLADQPAIIAAVKRWLRTHQNWLLIFDNAQDPADLKPYLPGGHGHVLVTSRNPNWGALASTQPVPLLPRDQAVAFLLKRTSQDDADTADKLAETLGDLPLALEQAGAYIAASGITLKEYLDLFQTRRQDLWGEEASPENYEHTVAATWSLSLEKAEPEAPGTAALLNLCAFLAPDAIPRSLLETPQEFLPPDLNRLAADSLVRTRVFKALRRYSLLEVAPESLTLHRLVQAVIRDRLDDPGRQQWAGAAVQLVNAAFPFDSDDVRTWEDCARLLPHALAAADYAEANQVVLEFASRLFNQAGLYLMGRAEYSAAQSAYERTLAIDEHNFGANHPAVAKDLNNLAMLFKDTGRFTLAEPLLCRALAILERSFGSEPPKVATVLNNLAMLLRDTGRLTEAEPLMRRALTIDEHSFGPDHPKVATDLNNLALLLKETNRLAEAEPLLRRALAIDERSFGPGHPNVAIRLNNLAQLLQATNRLTEAKPLLWRALSISETVFGPEHPTVAIRLNNLATLLQATKHLAEAEPLMRRALAIDENSLGPEHPNIARDLYNLARLLPDTNRHTEAEPLLRRALSIHEHSFGPGHPDVAKDLNNLATLLHDNNRIVDAEPLMRRAVTILVHFTRTTGNEHPDLQTCINNYMGVLRAMGTDEAEILTRLRQLAPDFFAKPQK